MNDDREKTRNELTEAFHQFEIGLFQAKLFNNDFNDSISNIINEHQTLLDYFKENKEHLLKTFDESIIESTIEYGEFARKLKEEYPNLINKMILVYIVALMDAFLADSIKIILYYKKDILKSRPDRKMTWMQILNYNNLDEIYSYMIDSVILDITHESIQGTIREINNLLNIKFERELIELMEVYATRNIIAHNGGLVNQLYKNQVAESKLNIGDKRKIDGVYIENARDKLERNAISLYKEILKKFDLGDPVPVAQVISERGSDLDLT